MACLEVVYTGSIDDLADKAIQKAAKREALSMSYDLRTRVRDLQFHYPTDVEARHAAERVRRIAFELKTYIR